MIIDPGKDDDNKDEDNHSNAAEKTALKKVLNTLSVFQLFRFFLCGESRFLGTFFGNSFCRFFPQQVPIYASQFVAVFLASVTNAFALVVNGTTGTVPQVFYGLVSILTVQPEVHPVLGGQFKVIQLCFQRRFGWECFPGAVRCSPDAVVREDHFFHRSGIGPCGRIGESDRVLIAPVGVSCDLQIQILIGNWFAQWIAYGI